MVLIGLLVFGGGVWVVQDGIASILYYPNESWSYNHALRLIRTAWGALFIYLGILLVLGG